jgi:4-amino-4-deoxy-L-arabinose transferase-like glycosyltransferase
LSRPAAARAAVVAILVGIAVAQWELVARMFGTGPFFDEGTYLLSVLDLRHGFALGEDVFASQPPLFYDLLRGLSHVFDPTLRGLRQATAATTLLVVPASFLLGRALVGRTAGVIAAAMLTIAAPFPLYGWRIFADTPSLALATVGLALAGAGAVEAAGAVLAAAVLVKLSAVTAVPAALALALLMRVAWRRLLFGVAASAIVLAVVALAHLSGAGEIWHEAVSYHTKASSSAVSLSNGHELRGFFNPRTPFLWLLVAGALGSVFSSWRVRALWLWPAVAVVFVATHRPLHENHLLTLPFAFAPAVGVGLGAGIARLGRLALPALACVAVLAVAGYVQQARNLDDQRVPVDERLVRAADVVRASTRPGDFVVSDQPYVPVLAGRLVPPDLVDTANLRFETGFLGVDRIEAAVRRYDVRVVVAGRSFTARPALVRWLRQHAASVRDVEGISVYRLGP